MAVFFIINLIIEYYNFTRYEQDHSQASVLQLDSVSKTYSSCSKSFDAVKGLSMSITRGECYGLIGLNGAGKSTTFKMITGQTRCTSGRVKFNCGRIGYCSQNNSLDEYISVQNHLWIYAMIAGYTSQETKIVTNQLLREYCMEKFRTVQCGHLSGGNKRKLCSAISMLGGPDIVLMDEPTSGMDPGTRRIVWRNIENLAKRGKFEKKYIYCFIFPSVLQDPNSYALKKMFFFNHLYLFQDKNLDLFLS